MKTVIPICCLVALMAPTRVHAAALTPPSLPPGSTYRLAFVTNDTIAATSANVADYNNFVNNEANGPGSLLAPFGATWTAIASTESVSAFNNIGGVFSDPVYNYQMSGLPFLVANGSADLWSGALENNHGIQGTQTDLPCVGTPVWTGTTSAGASMINHTLGEAAPEVGVCSAATSQWIDLVATAPAGETHYLYGISSELTIAGGPEPATLGTMLGRSNDPRACGTKTARSMRPSIPIPLINHRCQRRT